MTNANTNTGNLNPFFHPAAHYASPEDVLNDDELSGPEKRMSNPVPRYAKFPAWATRSGSRTSSRLYGGSTARTIRSLPGACR